MAIAEVFFVSNLVLAWEKSSSQFHLQFHGSFGKGTKQDVRKQQQRFQRQIDEDSFLNVMMNALQKLCH